MTLFCGADRIAYSPHRTPPTSLGRRPLPQRWPASGRTTWALLVALVLPALAGALVYVWLHKRPPEQTSAVVPVSQKTATVPEPPAKHTHEADPVKSVRPAARQPLPPLPIADPDAQPTDAAQLFDESSQVMDLLVEYFPHLPDALEVHARYWQWRGSSAKAVASWEQALELDDQYAHAYYGLGTLAAEQGRHEEAVRLLRRATSITSRHPRAEMELAQALVNLGRTQEAIDVLDQQRQTGTLNAEGSFLLAQAYAQQGDYAAAKQHYQDVLAAQADYADAWYGVATATARLGQTEESRQAMARFRELRSAYLTERQSEKVNYDDLEAVREEISRLYTNAGRVFFLNAHPDHAEPLWQRAVTLSPSNIEALQSLAWLYRQAEDLQQNIAVLRQLADIVADKAPYLLEIARLQAASGRLDQAEQVLARGVLDAPDSADLRAVLARLLLERDREPQRALELAEQAVQLSPTAEMYNLLAAARDRAGDAAGARAALRQALRLDPENQQYRQTLRSLQASQVSDTIARSLPSPSAPLPDNQAALIRESEQVTAAVTGSFPDDPQAWAVQAQYHNWLGNSELEAQACQRSLELNADFAPALLGLGRIAQRKGQYDEAVAYLRRALASAPERPQSALELARALSSLGQADEAAQVLRTNLGENNLSPEAHAVWGEISLQRRDYDAAKRHYEAVLANDPDQREAYHGLTTALRHVGQPEEAAQYAKEMEARTRRETQNLRALKSEYDDLVAMRTHAADLYLSAARVFFERGRPQEAQTLFKRAALLDPQDIESRRELAAAYFLSGRLTEAIATLEEATQLDPRHGLTLLELGRLYMQAQQFDAAEDVFRRLVEVAPQEVSGYQGLAQVHLLTGHHGSEAIAMAQQAVELQPNAESYLLLAAAYKQSGREAQAAEALRRVEQLQSRESTQ